jgi:nucleoside-diphosphate-sugar epimerase
MKSCLITGGTGYLAHSLVAELRGKYRIRRLIRPGAPPAPTAPGLENFIGDVTHRNTLEKALEGVDTVFHLAAQTSARVADEDPERDFEANVRPLEHILEICRDRQPRTFVVFAGTVTQSGVAYSLPADETHADRPVTAYDRHKLQGEQSLEAAVRAGAARGTTLRLSNLYGPGPREAGADRGVLNRMIRSALRGEPLTVYDGGNFLRDYLYVEDAAKAFASAAAHGEAVNGRHFVIASGVGRTLAEAARLIAAQAQKRTGRATEIRFEPPPSPLTPLDLRNFVGDHAAFTACTSWKPQTDLETGIDLSMTYWASLRGDSSRKA